MIKLLKVSAVAIFCMNLTTASAAEHFTKVSLPGKEGSAPYSKRIPQGDRTAWVCETVSYTCYPNYTRHGIGDACRCCDNGDCEWGTITETSSIDPPTRTASNPN
jgi:hypothetical protein